MFSKLTRTFRRKSGSNVSPCPVNAEARLSSCSCALPAQTKPPICGVDYARLQVQNRLLPLKSRALHFNPVPHTASIMSSQLITVDPEIHSGTPVFAGTRVPVKTLFDHLEEGDSLEVFLDDFPSVSRKLAVAVLEEARAALEPDVHPA